MRPKYKDRDFLCSMIIYAILETEEQLRRTPTKKEILDCLFSSARSDPEARDLERQIDELLTSLIEERAAMCEWET